MIPSFGDIQQIAAVAVKQGRGGQVPEIGPVVEIHPDPDPIHRNPQALGADQYGQHVVRIRQLHGLGLQAAEVEGKHPFLIDDQTDGRITPVQGTRKDVSFRDPDGTIYPPAFPDQEGLAQLMREAGFTDITWKNYTGGIAAVHVAHKK